MQVVDPAEETFPYSGRVEFIEPEGGGSITAGRAEAWKADYDKRVARHRAELRAETDKLGWSFAVHRTDRPATELLLALHARMAAPPPGAVGRRPRAGPEVGMMPWLPLGFAQPLVLLGLLSLPVLWWLLRLIPPQPTRIDFPPTRLLFDIKPQEETPRRTPWWLTLLRLALATLVILAAAGPLWNPAADATRTTSPLALLIDDGYPGRRHLGRAHAHRRRSDQPRRDRRPRRRAHSAVGDRPRDRLRDAGRGARPAQADQAEALCGAAFRRAARPDPFLWRDRRTSRRSGSPTASMPAAARISSRRSRAWSERAR